MDPQILIAGLFFTLGVLSMLGADFIIYLEEKKRREIRNAKRKKMHLPDCNRNRRA